MSAGFRRVLVLGSRTWADRGQLDAVLLDTLHDAYAVDAVGTVVLHPDAREGVGPMVAAWCRELEQPRQPYADPETAIRSAPDLCLAFLDADPTIAQLADRAQAFGIPTRRFTASP